MKDIKSYVIGFLTCACMFLIMGATYDMRGNGRYLLGSNGYYLLDTKTGELYTKGEEGKWFTDIEPFSD